MLWPRLIARACPTRGDKGKEEDVECEEKSKGRVSFGTHLKLL